MVSTALKSTSPVPFQYEASVLLTSAPCTSSIDYGKILPREVIQLSYIFLNSIHSSIPVVRALKTGSASTVQCTIGMLKTRDNKITVVFWVMTLV